MNLEEVARLAGVSRSTVSRVVNDDRRVSDTVRSRVQDIIRQHDYHPNAAARSLASRRTRILGLLIPEAVSAVFSDPFFPRLIQGAVEACNSADYNLLMLMDSGNESDVSDRLYRRVIRGHHLDGMLIVSSVVDDPMIKQLLASDFPFVLVGRHPRYQEISFVDVDNRAAAQSLVAHLLGHGYEQIAMIGGMRNMIATIDRYGGYVTALQEAGLMPDPQLIAYGDFDEQGGYRAMQQLLPYQPRAVFVASDMMAFGALQALRDAGIQVPEEIAVVGFDGVAQGAVSQPPLSTISQPISDLGREAIRVLLDAIERPDRSPVHRFLPTQLTIRRSCGCPETSGPHPLGGDRRAP